MTGDAARVAARDVNRVRRVRVHVRDRAVGGGAGKGGHGVAALVLVLVPVQPEVDLCWSNRHAEVLRK